MVFTKLLSNTKKSLLIMTLVIVLAITFETLQQLYYINRYQLAENVGFFDLLKNQALRWVIWVLLSPVLIAYIKFIFDRSQSNYKTFKLGFVIIGLVLLNILVISVSQMLLSHTPFSLNVLFSDFFPFFTYQKAPIYTLGYIAMSIIIVFYFENEKLQVEIQSLSTLKLTNAKLYQQLRNQVDEKSTVLTIKIGNKRKIIPIDHVLWIEADDYCVKVHTTDNFTYTMRSTLKALEEKLHDHFLRVHRKAIVNMKLAKELQLSQSPSIILQNDVKIPVSKSNLRMVKDFLY